MSSLKDTIGKIKNLEAEKKNLLLEIEELKKMADTKATALESEIGALRDEIKSLKILMNGPEPSVERKLKK
jgi:protein-arginine kinase activator protein McsA